MCHCPEKLLKHQISLSNTQQIKFTDITTTPVTHDKRQSFEKTTRFDIKFIKVKPCKVDLRSRPVCMLRWDYIFLLKLLFNKQLLPPRCHFCLSQLASNNFCTKMRQSSNRKIFSGPRIP